MIDAEIWRDNAGSLPAWRGKLPAIPREGDMIRLPSGQEGIVWRTTWILGERGLTLARVSIATR